MADPKQKIAEIVANAAPPPPLELVADGAAEKPRRSRKRKSKGDAGGGAPPELGAGDTPPEDLGPIEWEPENDVGNAKRLLHHFGGELRYVRGIGWFVWCDFNGNPVTLSRSALLERDGAPRSDPEADSPLGQHWHRDGADHAARRLGQITAARIKQEKPLTKAEREIRDRAEAAAKTPAPERSDAQKTEIIEWAKMRMDLVSTGSPKGRWAKRAGFSVSSGNSGKIKGMLEQAEPHRLVAVEALDRDPFAFNVLNGTLRFSAEADLECPDPEVTRLKWRARLDRHDRADLISKVAPVVYDPEARCPQWRTFLERVQPEKSVRRFLQRFYGYSITGLTDAQAFLVNHGSGANGKSTFIEVIHRVIGPYGGLLNPESFTGTNQRRGDQATPDLADLVGVRCLRISELPERARLQDNLIKAVTGGEPMKVRQLNQPFFTFRPVFKPTMSGNARPPIDDISEGLWRRLFLVPWSVMIPAEERKSFDEVQRIFEAEWSGILNWLVEGALAYLDTRRLDPPDIVVAATADYREDMDPIGEFLKACVQGQDGALTQAGKLYGVYLSWCDDSGMRPATRTLFGRTVPKHGWRKAKGHGGVRNYLDMELLPSAPPPRAPTKGDSV